MYLLSYGSPCRRIYDRHLISTSAKPVYSWRENLPLIMLIGIQFPPVLNRYCAPANDQATGIPMQETYLVLLPKRLLTCILFQPGQNGYSIPDNNPATGIH